MVNLLQVVIKEGEYGIVRKIMICKFERKAASFLMQRF